MAAANGNGKWQEMAGYAWRLASEVRDHIAEWQDANSGESGTCVVISQKRVTNGERSASPPLDKYQPATTVITPDFGFLGKLLEWHFEDMR